MALPSEKQVFTGCCCQTILSCYLCVFPPLLTLIIFGQFFKMGADLHQETTFPMQRNQLQLQIYKHGHLAAIIMFVPTQL